MSDILVVLLVLLVVFGLMGALAWWNWQYSVEIDAISLYAKSPLRRVQDLSYGAIGKVYLYLTSYHQYDNRMFNIQRITYCRETGRIFPDSIDIFGRVHLNWTFLNKRHRGTWVSWGSLTQAQQESIRRAHTSLEDYQTQFSSPQPSPRAIEPQYAMSKPGPLYVDIETKTLLGWKVVPGTDLEVLIVQKPKYMV